METPRLGLSVTVCLTFCTLSGIRSLYQFPSPAASATALMGGYEQVVKKYVEVRETNRPSEVYHNENP